MISENKSLDEQVGTELSKNSSVAEGYNYPVGYLTVIKNEGKPTEEIICKDVHNLLTTEGKAWVHDQLYQLCSGQTGAAAYIALSNDGSYTHYSGYGSKCKVEVISKTDLLRARGYKV